jgi:hypothetical protein
MLADAAELQDEAAEQHESDEEEEADEHFGFFVASIIRGRSWGEIGGQPVTSAGR